MVVTKCFGTFFRGSIAISRNPPPSQKAAFFAPFGSQTNWRKVTPLYWHLIYTCYELVWRRCQSFVIRLGTKVSEKGPFLWQRRIPRGQSTTESKPCEDNLENLFHLNAIIIVSLHYFLIRMLGNWQTGSDNASTSRRWRPPLSFYLILQRAILGARKIFQGYDGWSKLLLFWLFLHFVSAALSLDS